MRIFIKLISLSFLIFLLLVGYLFLTEQTTKYECTGEGRYSKSFIDKYSPELGEIENPTISEIGFLSITSYSRIVLLWSDDRHEITWEKPNENIQTWFNVVELGHLMQINDFENNIVGTFSKISNALSLVTNREFTGICSKI